MTTLTALCTIAAVGILLIILGYIAMQGISSLSFNFLIDSPKPVGEGGGIGNAILGSVVLLLLAAGIGLPIGVAIGIYLSEFGTGKFEFEILEEIVQDLAPGHNYASDLEALEDLWLEKLQPYGARGYNEKKKTRDERLRMIVARRRTD